jgi:hypothetical protein
MDDQKPIPSSAPQHWLDALERGEADIVAGRIIPASEIRALLREDILRMEAAGGLLADPDAIQRP